MERPYKTIAEPCRTEQIVRRSKFIASAVPVASKEDAANRLAMLHKEFPGATHHCYAYRLAPDGLRYRFADDGEPGGSAGKPILLCLQRLNLMNVMVVVTRFYGGVKLGIGPLARAYSDAATHVLNKATIIVKHPTVQFRVYTTYDDISAVRSVLDRYAADINEEFGDIVFYTVQIRKEDQDAFREDLNQATQGRAGAQQQGVDLSEDP